ncbi:ribose-phosphate diphosphokinase [Erythrobacter sp. sf7]|uniref:Ribose-phosphate diphosphokinase n=1 Tax=Erythrobacter fulvus TaxID=2987523 RepID=A0ABT5JR35_9SPHN|nr:ribose-phosphate diphosphokinase [Erythrobacter fulvus]MDC8754630.1 ribose-phosphate diphosphokinase [Erythrobacter fulvus]
MTAAAVHFFAEAKTEANRLAAALGTTCAPVAVHHFPDGESLVRAGETAPTALLYRSLDNPDAKLVELLLAAAALRDRGAQRVMLVAPYLCYMRQDTAFRPGEAVSQRVIGRLLADAFDGVLTVDPHLHRTHALGEVIPGIPAIAVSAAPLLAAAIDRGLHPAPILAGPDSESRQWVGEVARFAGLPFVIGSKQRRGDRDVSVTFAHTREIAGKPVVLVDDLVSSGRTLIAAAGALIAAGAARVEALAVHCLASEEDLAAMRAGGISRLHATDTVAGPTSEICVAPLLAGAIKNEGWT